MAMFQQPYKSLRRPSPEDYMLQPNTPTVYKAPTNAVPSYVNNGSEPPSWVQEATARGATTWDEIMAYKPEAVMTGAQYAALSKVYAQNPMQAAALVKTSELYRDAKKQAESDKGGTTEITTTESSTSNGGTTPISNRPSQPATINGQPATVYNYADVNDLFQISPTTNQPDYTKLKPGSPFPAGTWAVMMPDGTTFIWKDNKYVGLGAAQI